MLSLPGFYMGIMFGPATNQTGTQHAVKQGGVGTTPATSRTNQFTAVAFF